MKIEKSFEQYLSAIGRLKEESLGGEEEASPITVTNSKMMEKLLISQSKFNNNMLMVAIIGLCVIFIIDIFFIFYYKDNATALSVILGVTGLSLVGVIKWLRKLWLEKSVLDVSLAVVENLPPTEAAKFIETTYWSIIKKNNY